MESDNGSTKMKNARPKVLVTPWNRANPHLTIPFSNNGREVQAVLKLRTPSYATGCYPAAAYARRDVANLTVTPATAH